MGRIDFLLSAARNSTQVHSKARRNAHLRSTNRCFSSTTSLQQWYFCSLNDASQSQARKFQGLRSCLTFQTLCLGQAMALSCNMLIK